MCWVCRRPAVVCWCGDITKVATRTRVLFLQHPLEAKVGVSTCRMAHMCLPNSEYFVGLSALEHPRLTELCAEPGTALLFPSPGAVDLRDLHGPPLSTLVLVDGTWSTAKKLALQCPVLSKLPRVALTPSQPGNYRIRREPAPHCLATIEAAAQALEILEDAPGLGAPLLRAFDAMVERQLVYIRAQLPNASRHRSR